MGKGETGLNFSVSPEMIDSPGSQTQWICTKKNHVAMLSEYQGTPSRTDALQQASLETCLVRGLEVCELSGKEHAKEATDLFLHGNLSPACGPASYLCVSPCDTKIDELREGWNFHKAATPLGRQKLHLFHILPIPGARRLGIQRKCKNSPWL